MAKRGTKSTVNHMKKGTPGKGTHKMSSAETQQMMLDKRYPTMRKKK